MADCVEAQIQSSLRDYNIRQLMGLALIRTGLDASSTCKQAGLTKAQYNDLLQIYQDGNFDKLTTRVVENWGNIVLAKMMGSTEKSLNAIDSCLDNGEMKEAKMASDIFATLFDKFRLSTGKSTENVATVHQRINQMIEAKTAIQKPNQSAYHSNITMVNTSPPDLSEVM